MSAIPSRPGALDLLEARLESMQAHALGAVLEVEQSAYEWPWTEANVQDSIRSGYQCVSLIAGVDTLLGYYIAMQGVDEVHLLNLTVAPAYQRQGWARVMLDALALWSKGQNAQWLWLEVRLGNLRAQQVYDAYGFRRVGERKHYYPSTGAEREHAVVMSLKL